MKLGFRSFVLVTAAVMTVPVAGQAAALTLNGTCEVGSCASVDSVSFGQSSTTPFSFDYTANADTYLVSGTSSASYGNNGSLFNVYLSVSYIGNAPSTTNDSLKIDVLQNFFDNSPGTWDGTYTETVPVTLGGNVGAGSTVSAQLFYDGQGVGVLGPFGPGSNLATKSKYLSGLTGDYLDADYQFTFDFAAGTQPNAGGVLSTTTPEPADILLLALGGGVFGIAAWARRARELGLAR